MSPTPPADPPALVQIRTLWSALTIGCLMYVVVARWMSPAAAPRSQVLPDPADPLEMALAIAAVASVAVGFVMSRAVARAQRARLGDAPVSEEALFRAALMPLLVRYALFESAAVFGMVLVVMGHPAAKVVPFVLLAVAALLTSFPTRERVRRLFSD